jgi:hypothetical protein
MLNVLISEKLRHFSLLIIAVVRVQYCNYLKNLKVAQNIKYTNVKIW